MRMMLAGFLFVVFLCMSVVFNLSGCLQSKPVLVDKTPEQNVKDDVLVKVVSENEKKNSEPEQKQKDDGAGSVTVPQTGSAQKESKIFMDEEGIPLDMHFADISGRTNPFIPPGASMGIAAPLSTSPASTPLYAMPSTAVPTLPKVPIKGQLMPLPNQSAATTPTVPSIPEWPGESPVLSAGPPERLHSLLDLRYRGLITKKSGKKVGVVELKVTDDNSGSQKTLSYIVTPGKIITEYNLKVKDLNAHNIVLVRGSQRIELPLVEKGTVFIPSEATGAQQSPYATKAGSNAQWTPQSSGTGSTP